MGSGVFLAAVVVAWFLVLVPMILTRRDAAVERALVEDDVSGSRVLRRTTAGAAAHSRRRVPMSARESSPSPDIAAREIEHDDVVDTAVHERIVDSSPDEYVETPAPRRAETVREQVVARRRTTLLVLGAVLVVTLVAAMFAGSWTWLLPLAAAGGLGAYVVHLRAEARRDEERRLMRETRANRARPRPAPRASSQSSLAANAFVGGGAVAASEAEVVGLDDEDLAFYDLADAPVADQVDLSGHDYYAEYAEEDAEYDYDSEAYGIAAPGEPDDGIDMPRAV